MTNMFKGLVKLICHC